MRGLCEVGRGGYRDRKERLAHRKPGPWATSSQDFLYVVSKLYALSWREATKSANGNWSGYICSAKQGRNDANYNHDTEGIAVRWNRACDQWFHDPSRNSRLR